MGPAPPAGEAASETGVMPAGKAPVGEVVVVPLGEVMVATATTGCAGSAMDAH